MPAHEDIYHLTVSVNEFALAPAASEALGALEGEDGLMGFTTDGVGDELRYCFYADYLTDAQAMASRVMRALAAAGIDAEVEISIGELDEETGESDAD
jgi:hypothetical protein